MNSDTSDFLSTLLFCAADGPYQGHNHRADWTVHDFHPEFAAAVDSFLSGFRAYLSTLAENPDLSDEGKDTYESPEEYTRGSFGGNVYLSLSGAGCGFQDDSETEALHAALMDYSGSRYRFEDLESDLYKFKGKIHVARRTAAFRREALARYFGTVSQPATA